MRINKFVALATGMSRRGADEAVSAGLVSVNGRLAEAGEQVTDSDLVKLNNKILKLPVQKTTIMLNKPVGYVVSRSGQGSKTIYDLLPEDYYPLKAVGRLDKESSGLLLLTNDGELANRLTHPSYSKSKVYVVTLNKALASKDKQVIEKGVQLEDGISRLDLAELGDKRWQVTMSEGRNRQIRRTFSSLGYMVDELQRTKFGPYKLEGLKPGGYKQI